MSIRIQFYAEQSPYLDDDEYEAIKDRREKERKDSDSDYPDGALTDDSKDSE